MLTHTEKRLTIHLTEQAQDKLQMAADLVVGATMNQFVVQAALEKAENEKIIERESTIIMTRRESLRLLELLENPTPRNEKFLQAMNRYQQMKCKNLSAAG